NLAVGTLRPGADVRVEYRMVVSDAIKPGENLTQVTGTAIDPLGGPVVSTSRPLRLIVDGSMFGFTQMVIGRVFEDANANSRYDAGERGIAGVRVVTSTGLAATTDAAGMYNLPSLAPGTIAVSIDPSTVPAGFVVSPSA